jgi:hypothetical protein
MKTFKRPLIAVAGLAALALVATSGGAGAASVAPGAAAVFNNSVFAGTYVSTGATASTVNGDVVAGTYLTLGATSQITGASSAGTAITLGALAGITGTATSFDGGNTTTGAGELAAAQNDLSALTPFDSQLLGNQATDITYQDEVYEVNGLRTYTANTNITINVKAATCADFVLNASGYITFGAGVTVTHNVPSSCANEPQVFWNSGGYISVGAGADMIGTFIATTYVSLGATASVEGPGDIDNCGGGVYSLTSYVSLGAGATVSSGGACGSTVDCVGEDIFTKTTEKNDNGYDVDVYTKVGTTCDCDLD